MRGRGALVALVLSIAAIGGCHGKESQESPRSTGWGRAQRIGDAGETQVLPRGHFLSGGSPRVAVDRAGRARAVWVQLLGNDVTLGSNRFDPATGWGTAELIETAPVTVALGAPALALQEDGSGFVAFAGSRGSRDSVWASRLVPGRGWEAPVEIGAGDPGGFPQVGFDSSGSAVALWVQTFSQQIWSNRFLVGAGWGTAERIGEGQDERAPALAVAPDGSALAVWTDFLANGGTRTAAALFTPQAGWSAPERLQSSGARSVEPADVGVDASGVAIAVWPETDGPRRGLWFNRFTPSSGWATAAAIESADVNAGSEVHVAVDPSGRAIVVWVGGQRLRANRFTPAAGWDPSQGVAAERSDEQGAPLISMDSAGNAVAVWAQFDSGSGRGRVWAARFLVGSGWTSSERIQDENGGPAVPDGLDVNASGNALAVWAERDASGRVTVWANRFVPGAS